MNLGNVSAAVCNENYWFVGVPEHFSKNIDVDIVDWGVFRVGHRHGKVDVLQAIHQGGEVTDVFKNRSPPFTGLHVLSKGCIRASAIEGVFTGEVHCFGTLLVIETYLFGSCLQSLFNDMRGHTDPITIGNLATFVGKHLQGTGMLHFKTRFLEDLQSRRMDCQGLFAV